MPDDFDQVDEELVVAIADLQERIATVAQTLNLAAFAAQGLSSHADRRGDVARVYGCEKAAERLRQAAGYVQSAAVLLRMIEEPDEWTQERRSDRLRDQDTVETRELDLRQLRTSTAELPRQDLGRC